MFSFVMRGGSRGLLLLAAGIGLAAAAQAQNRAALPAGAIVQPLDDGAGAELRRNLTTLAQNPRSVTALNGAGRAALDMGDADAALSFFARAAEAEPGNARARAGMAQALVRLERPREAMPLFAEALSRGAPEAEIAGDRGLAWDTLGEPGRAQADYALALRREDDPELRRRMALSLAISGRREEALRMIEAQLRNHDRAGWRTQAFVLALTGDAAGAERTARDMMPQGAQALAPFLARLAALSPSQKALAVHFGHFPGDGRAAAYAQADTRPDPGAMALAQRTYQPPADRTAPRRRPDVAAPIERSAGARRRDDRDDRDDRGTLAEPVRRRVELADAQPRRPVPRPPQTEAPPWPEPVLDQGPNAGFTILPQRQPQPALPRLEPRPEPRLEPPVADLSGVAAVVASLEDAQSPPAPAAAPPRREARTPPRPEPQPAARAPARTAEARTPSSSSRTSRARPAPPANPARAWVQIATGEKAGLAYTLRTFRERAPALLGGRGAWTAPVAATNRLLIGPFASEREAQAFVNQLASRNVPGLVWTSAAGQGIDRLQTANDTRSASSRSQPEQRTAARGSGARAEPRQGASARGSGNRTQIGRGSAARGAASRTQAEQPTAVRSSRASRGQSKPEPRPAARGRRSR
jgi:tetratricopeptide (TPR) repeat protein